MRQWYGRRPNFPVWKTALHVLQLERPEDLTLLRELAHVHEQLGEADEALGVLRKLIGLDPADEESRLLLAELYNRQGRPLEAFAHLNHLKSNNWNLAPKGL